MFLIDLFRVSARLGALTERLETLEREHRDYQLEMESLFEKTKRLHGRIAKRQSVAEQGNAPGDLPQIGAPRPMNGFSRRIP